MLSGILSTRRSSIAPEFGYVERWTCGAISGWNAYRDEVLRIDVCNTLLIEFPPSGGKRRLDAARIGFPHAQHFDQAPPFHLLGCVPDFSAVAISNSSGPLTATKTAEIETPWIKNLTADMIKANEFPFIWLHDYLDDAFLAINVEGTRVVLYVERDGHNSSSRVVVPPWVAFLIKNDPADWSSSLGGLISVPEDQRETALARFLRIHIEGFWGMTVGAIELVAALEYSVCFGFKHLWVSSPALASFVNFLRAVAQEIDCPISLRPIHSMESGDLELWCDLRMLHAHLMGACESCEIEQLKIKVMHQALIVNCPDCIKSQGDYTTLVLVDQTPISLCVWHAANLGLEGYVAQREVSALQTVLGLECERYLSPALWRYSANEIVDLYFESNSILSGFARLDDVVPWSGQLRQEQGCIANIPTALVGNVLVSVQNGVAGSLDFRENGQTAKDIEKTFADLRVQHDVFAATQTSARRPVWRTAGSKLTQEVLSWSPMRVDWSGELLTVNPESRSPKVSVIMPVLNRVEEMKRAIASLDSQTSSQWELIIVDNGSNDGSFEFASGLVSERIRVFREALGGVGAARNRGVLEARTNTLIFLDSDNVYSPDFVAEINNRSDDAVWAYGDYAVVTHEGVNIVGQPFDEDLLRRNNYIDQNALVVSKAAVIEIGGFNDSLLRAVDYDLVLRLLNRFGEPKYLENVIAAGMPLLGGAARITESAGDEWTAHVRNEANPAWSSNVSHKGRVSVIVPTYNRPGRLLEMLARELRLELVGINAEVFFVDDGQRAPIQLAALELNLSELGVKLMSTGQSEGFASACNLGAQGASGSLLLFWNDDCHPTRGSIKCMLDAYEASGCPDFLQPIILNVSDSPKVESLGVALPEVGLPYALGQGLDLTPEILAAVDGLEVPAISGACFLISTKTFRENRGFDPIYRNGFEDLDLCLRIQGGGGGVVSNALVLHEGSSSGEARFTHIARNRAHFVRRHGLSLGGGDEWLWRQLGFDLAGYGVTNSKESLPVPVPRISRLINDSRFGSSQKRVGLRCAAASRDATGNTWGDALLAAGLVRVLKNLGVDSELLYRDSIISPKDFTVVVDLLGLLEPLEPLSDSSLETWAWIISHPDRWDAQSLETYSRVFSGSHTWHVSGREFDAVWLQPTDMDSFEWRDLVADTRELVQDQAVFVGNSRGAHRWVIDAAVDLGIPVMIFGKDWHRLEGRRNVTLMPPISRRFVPEIYRNARLVLNDHWPSMLINGFLSNRVSDLIYCGANFATDAPAGWSVELANYGVVVERHKDVEQAWASSHSQAIAVPELNQPQGGLWANGITTEAWALRFSEFLKDATGKLSSTERTCK